MLHLCSCWGLVEVVGVCVGSSRLMVVDMGGGGGGR